MSTWVVVPHTAGVSDRVLQVPIFVGHCRAFYTTCSRRAISSDKCL